MAKSASKMSSASCTPVVLRFQPLGPGRAVPLRRAAPGAASLGAGRGGVSGAAAGDAAGGWAETHCGLGAGPPGGIVGGKGKNSGGKAGRSFSTDPYRSSSAGDLEFGEVGIRKGIDSLAHTDFSSIADLAHRPSTIPFHISKLGDLWTLDMGTRDLETEYHTNKA